ncbi:MAG: twin-arginine translocation signal domain-containing protein, partial [Candidatus Omnitrophica bacterium]|nr:twin-arginine translocation signal domain-containing protein [Candidatus Omnitrophota bacterium]
MECLSHISVTIYTHPPRSGYTPAFRPAERHKEVAPMLLTNRRTFLKTTAAGTVALSSLSELTA